VRESSVCNFVIILIKRLFRDEAGLSLNLLNKISAALGAVERIYNPIYKQVIKEKLSKMLAEAKDLQLKRIFPFLINRVESWREIERAVKVRMEELITAMSVEEMISFRIVKVASIISDINSVFQQRIKNIDSHDMRKILENTATNVTKNQAIKVFISSGSFDSAYQNGIKSLLPHAEFFNDDDMQSLFKGVYENSVWKINQILNSGGIDEVFCQLYRNTKTNLNRHNEIWKEFWETVQSKGFSYEGLKEILAKDQVIEIEPIEEDNED